MSSQPTQTGRSTVDLVGPPGPSPEQAAIPATGPEQRDAAKAPAAARQRALWPGLLALVLGLAVVLVVLALQVTSVAQTVALAMPVVFIGLGLAWIGRSLSVRTLRRLGIVLVAVALAGPVIMAASPPRPLARTTVRAAMPPGATEASLRATMGTGQLRVRPGGPGLFEAELSSSGRSQSSVITSGSAAVVDLRAPAQRSLLARNRGSDWNVALSTAVPWRVEVDADAIIGDLDLQQLNLRAGRIDVGPSRLALRLGPPAERIRLDLRLTTGVVDVYVPKGAGLELESQGPVIRDFGGRKLQQVGTVWRTAGDLSRSYVLRLDSGPGRIRLHWR